MKKLLAILGTACVLAGCTAATAGQLNPAAESVSLTKGCKAAYLMDYGTGECIYKENETKRMPIASVCKVMTLTLCFDAINEGKLALDDMITASENAAGMGGSQVFLGSGCQYPLDQLIKSIVVCSANDSCVAVSEAVAGSEEGFVAQMNKKATELGCANTLFANCTGLPKETQYSCAKDVAVMFRNLLENEGYYNYSKVWLEDFVHPDNRVTSMTNTNKLIRKYSNCDGGKTGFTNEAGFCLTATAKKDNMRLISVILGADSSDNRFNSTVSMFDYGFANYKNKIILDKDVTLNDEFAVIGGKKDSFAVCPERNSYVFSAIDKTPEVTHNLVAYKVKAPVAKGQVVGKIEVYRDGVLCDTVNVVAAEEVKKANFGDNFVTILENWAI
ncbi:MAG: D-alanyl-D-alanine carboxypeptidase [Clostridia bacterium]|nr:D-alanyl-D-alanine carboxypeptidase [Clostridia bacterium]